MNEEIFLDAAENGDLETVKKLLESGVDVNSKDEHDRTALLKASNASSSFPWLWSALPIL